MSYIRTLKDLEEEINSELSIWDLHPVLEDWFDYQDEETQEKLLSLGFDPQDQDNFMNAEYFKKFHDDFRKYAEKNMSKIYDFYRAFGEGPACLDKSNARLLKNEWLVNFSHSRYSNCRNGFTVGLPLFCNEGRLTNMHKELDSPGFNFGYSLKYRAMSNNRFIEERIQSYGSSISLFKGNGVKFIHYGDEEEQVMFLGEQVRRIYCVSYEEWSQRFYIEILSKRETKEIYFDSLQEVADFIDGYYRKSNIAGYINNSKK